METDQDLTKTLFVLPPDTNLLALEELAPRVRTKLGAVNHDDIVITRPGFRVMTRQVSKPLADLLSEFRTASLLTDAVVRFSESQGQDASDILDLSFESLLTFVNGRILVPHDSAEAKSIKPSLAAAQDFAGFEIENLVRSLNDTEVYQARSENGDRVALKISRDQRASADISNEASFLKQLDGKTTPLFHSEGTVGNRSWLAMEWKSGQAISVKAQELRAAGDLKGLHLLVTKLLDAYALLHSNGILHGDVHTGNVLANHHGDITILDFGQARWIGSQLATDPRRTGIPIYHDPQLASALLDEAIPPSATQLSEQYSIATLCYLLYAGKHPIHFVADRNILLKRIVDFAPLPFAASGLNANPGVERVLNKALAKHPHQRHENTQDFADAFRSTAHPNLSESNPIIDINSIIDKLRSGDQVIGQDPFILSWLSLRAAIARSDAELLAIAEIWAARSGEAWQACSLKAQVARARTDHKGEREAIDHFLVAIENVSCMRERCEALLCAAQVLKRSSNRNFDLEPVRKWVERTLVKLWPLKSTVQEEEIILYSTLIAFQCGALSLPGDFRNRLDTFTNGSVWLRSLAYDIFQDPNLLDAALASKLPGENALRGFALLRLHQLTGDIRWIEKAKQQVDTDHQINFDAMNALLAIEIENPARALAPFDNPFAGRLSAKIV